MKPTLKNNWRLAPWQDYPEDDDVNPEWDADWDDVIDPSEPPEESEQKGRNMQKTINKYQSRFDGLMKSIEKDKILKKMPGNATAGIAVQMIKDLKNYLKVNKA